MEGLFLIVFFILCRVILSDSFRPLNFRNFGADGQTKSSTPFTIMGTVDGFLHAVDSYTLEKKWSISTGGPLLSAHEVKFFRKYFLFVVSFHR
jgi:hypothetical protein